MPRTDRWQPLQEWCAFYCPSLNTKQTAGRSYYLVCLFVCLFVCLLFVCLLVCLSIDIIYMYVFLMIFYIHLYKTKAIQNFNRKMHLTKYLLYNDILIFNLQILVFFFLEIKISILNSVRLYALIVVVLRLHLSKKNNLLFSFRYVVT